MDLTLRITVISAKDLSKLNHIMKMNVYTEVNIIGDDSVQKAKTPVDKKGGQNPSWDHTVEFKVKDSKVLDNSLFLVLKVKNSKVLGDKSIGEVRVPVRELHGTCGPDGTERFVTYLVLKPDGKSKGLIYISYRFLTKEQVDDEYITMTYCQGLPNDYYSYPSSPEVVPNDYLSYPSSPEGDGSNSDLQSNMEQLTFEIIGMSAIDLNYVNLIGKMDVYFAISIDGDNWDQKFKTLADREGGSFPRWNFSTKFNVNEGAVQQDHLHLVVKLMSELVLGDKEIGEVRVPLKMLLDLAGSCNDKKSVSYQVRKPDGKARGVIEFSYRFMGKSTSVDGNIMRKIANVDDRLMRETTKVDDRFMGETTKVDDQFIRKTTQVDEGIKPTNEDDLFIKIETTETDDTIEATKGDDQYKTNLDELVEALCPLPDIVGTSSCPPSTGAGAYEPPPRGVFYPTHPAQAPLVARYVLPDQYPQQQAYGGHPRQQADYGYGYKPQRGYEYGREIVVKQPERNEKGRMRLGAQWLRAGVIGGGLGWIAAYDYSSPISYSYIIILILFVLFLES